MSQGMSPAPASSAMSESLEIEAALAVLAEYEGSDPPGLDDALRVLRKSRYLRQPCGDGCILSLPVPDFDYDLIESIDQLAYFAGRLHAEVALGRRFGFDIETGYEGEDREKAQLHPEEGLVAGISLGVSEVSGVVWGRYAALNHDNGPNLDNYQAAEVLWKLLRTGHGVAHNASFEIRFLAVWFMAHLADHPELGPEVRAAQGYFPVFSDTMIEAFVEAKFKSSKHRSSEDGIGSEAALKPLTAETFGHSMTEIFDLFETISGKEMTKKQKNSIRFNVLDLTGPHRRMIIDYVCEDAVWCLAHHYKRYPEVCSSLIFQVELGIVPCVVEMDAEGIVFDWQGMREAAVRATDFAEKLKDEILSDLTVLRAGRGFTDGACQINLGSPPQLAKVLYELTWDSRSSARAGRPTSPAPTRLR